MRITIETCMLNRPHMCNKELLQTSSQHLNPLSQLQIIKSSTSNSSALFLCTIYLLKFNSKEMTLQKWSLGHSMIILSNEKHNLLNF